MKKLLLALVLVALLVQATAIAIIFTNPLLRRSPEPCRKSHLICMHAAGAGTNYQMRIKVHYGSGADHGEDVYLNHNVRVDFGDVRFMDEDGATELDYWMQEKVNGRYAIFWVEVADDLSSNNQTIYLYYGNSSLSTTSNGVDTFIFFDDFSGSSLDTNKWELLQGDVGIANSSLEITGTTGIRGSIRTRQTFSYGVALHSKAKGNDTEQWSQRWHLMKVGSGQNVSCLGVYGWNFDNQIGYRTRNSYENLEYTVVTISDLTTWHIFETRWTWSAWDQSGKAIYLVDEEIKATHTNYVPTTDLHIKFTEGNVDCGTVYTDWIFLRKFVHPEPSHGAWGAEETVE